LEFSNSLSPHHPFASQPLTTLVVMGFEISPSPSGLVKLLQAAPNLKALYLNSPSVPALNSIKPSLIADVNDLSLKLLYLTAPAVLCLIGGCPCLVRFNIELLLAWITQEEELDNGRPDQELYL